MKFLTKIYFSGIMHTCTCNRFVCTHTNVCICMYMCPHSCLTIYPLPGTLNGTFLLKDRICSNFCLLTGVLVVCHFLISVEWVNTHSHSWEQLWMSVCGGEMLGGDQNPMRDEGSSCAWWNSHSLAWLHPISVTHESSFRDIRACNSCCL